jgi:GNAT superfamily N-acetyltransferase
MRMPEPLAAPAKLTPAHETDGLDCGVADLTDWLRRWAYGNQQAGNASTFVAARGQRVVGYYALATCGVEKSSAPARIVKGGVPAQVPCLLLARLAVDLDEQGSGLGRGLLVDALRRAVRVADNVGIRALLIHARDEEARDFYVHHGEFVESPTDPLHLFMLLKQARKMLTD